ncbi:DNA ligase 4, partial [Asbolus verrucosus]
MNFASVCDFLDILRSTKGLAEKTKLTKTFLKTVRDEQHDFFSVLRLVVPKLDRDRPSYKIKESKISKLLIKMLGLPQGNDKNLLLKSVMGSSIDFGDVVYSVLKKYIVNKEIGMTVPAINAYLDRIATRTTDNGLDDLVLEIFRKLSPKNTKWLIQIILKDLKLGISDNSILNCFHEDAANFYATNNNLKKVCVVLNNPQVKLHELEINVFEPFRPMLSKRCDAANFKKCFPDSKMFIIENKFDGERFQLHMEGGKFKYFSRNGIDFTNSYGGSYDEGNFTPLLKNVFGPETKRVILDGEMMIWNAKTQHFGSKGMNLDIKKLMSELKEGRNRDDIVDALNSSVDNNEEGIVVKDPKSVYKCSDRNSGWFKIKMEYFDDVVQDLDVIMMGGCYGSGNKINSFFVGVLSGINTYLSLGRISSGLNDEQLDVLNDKLKSSGADFKLFSTNNEGKLMFGKDTPDVYIEPQNSCILQIRATELIRTSNDSVKCPYTLRFPRVLSIREDKPVDECLTMNELLELTSQNKAVIKLNKRHIELSEIISKSKPAKKIKLEVVNLEQPKEAGDFLNGKRFYVHSEATKGSLKRVFELMEQTDEFLNVNNAVVFDQKYQIFENYIAYFDSFEDINNPNSKRIYYSFPDEMHFEFYGGTVSKEITFKVNLIIIGDGDEDRKTL